MSAADLAIWRQSLEVARSSTELLDMLLSPEDAAARIQTLPGETIYRLIQRIGLEDCTELLPLCSGEQVQACIDFDGWIGDLPAIERIDPWMRALMVSGHETLVERLLDLDDALLNWIVLESCEVHVIEDPDSFEAPDLEHVLTLDQRLCIVFPDPGERDMPVKLFLDIFMRENTEHCYNLLVFAGGALKSTLEDDSFRWRQGRLADLGFVDPIEALGIYTAPRADQIEGARRSAPPLVQSDTLTRSLRGDERLGAAMAQLRANVRTTVANELVYVCNTALSADRVPLWDSEAQELTLRRVRAGLMLGLDALSSAPGVEGDAEVLGRVPVALIFRTGYARTLDAARLALKSRRRGLLVGPGGPLDALDQPLLKTWTEALTDRHPHLPGDRTPRTAEDLSRMRGFAEVVGSLVDFPGGGRPETAGLCAWVLTQLVRDVLGLEDSGPLPLSHLATAHRALFADGAVTETARAAIFAAAERKGLVHRPTVEFLLAWAAEELAQQTPENLEARFCAPLVLGP